MSTLSIHPESHLPFPTEERAAAAGDLQGIVVDLVDLSVLGLSTLRPLVQRVADTGSPGTARLWDS